jgi:predicted AlkP superfamily phosphohydrolase/phosphomutase
MPVQRPPKGFDRRSFLQLVAGSTAAAGLSSTLSSCGLRSSASGRRAIVLGLDGLDPKIINALIGMGRAPNFKKLMAMGSFMPLQTTMPALSPVAWSSFITGMTPGGHGIVDFTVRDPETYTPKFSIFENTPPDLAINLGDVELPIKGGGPRNNRHGTPFWSYLTERGIPAWVSKIPTNYPVDESATLAISGMGTPDLTDSYGSFSYFTSDTWEHYPDISGGTVQYVEVRDNRVDAKLLGPEVSDPAHNTTADPFASKAKIDFTCWLDAERKAVRIDIQGHSLVLNEGEYSDWVPVSFEVLPVIGTVGGIVRFLVKEVGRHFKLYATPINIDPSDQATPVTYPSSLGADIARDIGAFWTKGLPCDTKAFDYDILNDEQYVGQAQLVLAERMDLFDHLWSRFEEGLFYFYVSSTDQDTHMLWRNMDPTHPLHDRSDIRYAGYIHHMYEEMDRLLGKVLPAAEDDNTLLLVCSDHGFAQFGRQFHLNTWLRDNGYLTIKDAARSKEETSIFDVDWSKTVAYGIGFNGLYVNRKGREGQGIVTQDKVADLTNRLRRELEGLTDGETGQRPVAKVYPREEVYTGEFVPDMPELLVGYTPGYRSASSSVLGNTGKEIIDLNPWAWSGDHSMARDLVPGSLFTNRAVAKADPSILDLPVTILEFFGISKPAQMEGSSLFPRG